VTHLVGKVDSLMLTKEGGPSSPDDARITGRKSDTKILSSQGRSSSGRMGDEKMGRGGCFHQQSREKEREMALPSGSMLFFNGKERERDNHTPQSLSASLLVCLPLLFGFDIIIQQGPLSGTQGKKDL